MPATSFTNPCGHPFNSPRVIITTRRFDNVVDDVAPRLACISGGRWTLLATSCGCGQTTYLRQSTIGTDSRTVEDTRQAVTSVLADVLAEATEVFTLEFQTDRPLHVVVPRHQLALFVVETWGQT